MTVATLIAFGIWLGDLLFRAFRKRLGRPATEERMVIVQYARSLLPALVLIVLVRGFLYEPYQIPSRAPWCQPCRLEILCWSTSTPTGCACRVLGTKVFEVDNPERGDVMVFVPPHDDRYFIKRVIGLPGDKIVYVNKSLYVNGERVAQRLIERNGSVQAFEESLGEEAHTIHASGLQPPRMRREWIVPSEHFFVMGDNRDFSEDSRSWGFVSEAKIVGKAVAIWAHKDAGWNLPTFERNRFI